MNHFLVEAGGIETTTVKKDDGEVVLLSRCHDDWLWSWEFLMLRAFFRVVLLVAGHFDELSDDSRHKL